MTVRVIDCETTGTDAAVDEVIEIASVDVLADGTIANRQLTLVRPGIPVPPGGPPLLCHALSRSYTCPCLIAYRFAAAARWAMNPVEFWFSAQVGAQMLSILAANISGPAVLHVGDQVLLAVEPNRQHPLANLLHELRIHYCADRRCRRHSASLSRCISAQSMSPIAMLPHGGHDLPPGAPGVR